MNRVLLGVALIVCCFGYVFAQGTSADYERASGLRVKYEAAAIDIAGNPTWIGASHRFWYRKLSRGVNEYVIFDADTLKKQTAFDHTKIAASLSKLNNASYKPGDLSLTQLRFDSSLGSFTATIDGTTVRCTIADSACTKLEVPPPGVSPANRPQPPPVRSPDGKWEALINNYNLVVRPIESRDAIVLSTDGSEGNYYNARTIVWSPDSTKIAVYRVRPGYRREVRYVESSPEDQVQPKFSSIVYAKPGDVLDLEQPVLFEVATRKQMNVDNTLFPNPFEISDPVWRKDSRAFTFEYNQRGHQAYRVIEVGAGGQARALISDEPKTFFSYRPANGSLADSGKRYRYDVDDGKEIIWMSERDGWGHLYLYDGATGSVKNQITRGEWVVRGVQRVDEAARQIWFCAGGTHAGKDPYFLSFFRINFDGTGLTELTTADANHNVSFSTDSQLYVNNYSRLDLPNTLELRKTSDNSTVATVERGDASELAKTGWQAPEVFTAKGRDGKTDIWGVIIRPTNFDPSKRYPVIENIYAGPQGSFVPKSFLPYSSMMAQAEIGFIVVQIDGMGTANRSKAFHDVAWKNLGDAGFPDRILWHKAVAAKYPWYDISRVGIYGGSAGGQNSLGGLLFHPDFYKVAVSYAGCHDNRMDKIWWNEQWMGWPIGPQYSASSNVDNAYRLQGELLLVVGEMDTNVDPSSTMQVVSKLIKANKNFDLLVVPGANHGAARGDRYATYGAHKQYDFFVRHLLGVNPPPWNKAAAAGATQSAR
ncbi:MAG TPA: prolyl oligopeptidase family serine peptidase [Pyrinomonadaceae bacterium]|nr:prolyl oligopeptidase family serine peptidase [Pyrinomonadaceae bacterium]